MPHIERSDGMRCCSKCGERRPLEEFPKHRHLLLGKEWAKRAAWQCDACMAEVRTAGVRRYRQDAEKRERDREASRRWKREHLGQPGEPRVDPTLHKMAVQAGRMRRTA